MSVIFVFLSVTFLIVSLVFSKDALKVGSRLDDEGAKTLALLSIGFAVASTAYGVLSIATTLIWGPE